MKAVLETVNHNCKSIPRLTLVPAACENNKEFAQGLQVYLMSVPPGVFESGLAIPGIHRFHQKHNRKYIVMVREFRDIIMGQFAGHHHTDTFRVFYNKNDLADPFCSWEADEAWRVTYHYFHFDPLHGNHRVEVVNFQWTDGVFGVALSRPDAQGERTVFFHALSSLREFSVPAGVLRNHTAALATGPDSYYHYRDLGFKGNDTQATASYLDLDTGVLFFTQLNRNGVACWNTQKPLEPANVHLLVSDGERLSFPNDLKVDAEGTLWVLTDRLPVYVYKGGLDPNTVNYRIFSAAVKDLIKGTVC
ncbi:L-dopachrome tautomerase yellow-f2-like [Schistocerca serialis cubense]|uniref:L-dopachrome tautomerase yellow-f2-like n=1 Tax=Schistocerca serialis cubense TaxID=2023355 RepID=UPI00214DF33B|nr:L-dopachrome tautomerase yellow-f2-like [Schistocerca serialis cubense]